MCGGGVDGSSTWCITCRRQYFKGHRQKKGKGHQKSSLPMQDIPRDFPPCKECWRRSEAGIRHRFNNLTCPEPNSGCVLWLGSLNRHGYGTFSPDTRMHTKPVAHRVAWILEHGPIADGLFVLHKCDVPTCVNVRHLYLGSLFDNNRDIASRNRGHKSAKGLPFGVVPSKQSKSRPYQVQVQFNSRRYYLGTFPTADEGTAVATKFREQLANAKSVADADALYRAHRGNAT